MLMHIQNMWSIVGVGVVMLAVIAQPAYATTEEEGKTETRIFTTWGEWIDWILSGASYQEEPTEPTEQPAEEEQLQYEGEWYDAEDLTTFEECEALAEQGQDC